MTSPAEVERAAAALIEDARHIGLRLDRNGTFWHQGTEVRHGRLRLALLRWLDVSDDGRAIVRLDERRYAYVEVDDAALLVTRVEWRGDHAMLQTNDDRIEELRYHSLVQGVDHALYCRVRVARLLARFTTGAYYRLVERIEEHDEGFFLRAAGGMFGIGALA